MHAFEYANKDSRFSHIFNKSMISHTTLIINKILDKYKGFEELKELVDVGGGLGLTLKMITSKYPNIKGINFYLSHVIQDAPPYPGASLFLVLNTNFIILISNNFWPNYKLHLLTLVKIQFSPLSFDRVNSVL